MTKSHGKVVAAATDGACSGNPGPGGWAALLRFEDGSIEEFGGFDAQTTNNRMELKAALVLLERLKDLPLHPGLQIRTDSKYLINGFQQWIKGWKMKGWKTASGKPVLNQDLWEALDHARLPGVSLSYVKGHSGDPDNDRVDQIAVSFSKGLTPKLCSQSKDSSGAFGLNPHSDKGNESGSFLPSGLQTLLSRLEMANLLATKGYGLSLEELSQLVDQPLKSLEMRNAPWIWRDWVVEPMEDSRWRLRPFTNSLSNTEELQDG